MRRPATLLFWALLVWTAGFLVSLSGCGGRGASISTTPPPPAKIQHVVVVFQENRTPDNLFQDPNLIARGADIVQSGTNSLGQTIPLTPLALAGNYSPDHSHSSFVKMYDGGKMDGADKIPVHCAPNVTGCPPPHPQFASVSPPDVAPYFQLAEQYTFADRMFQTNQGPSFPAHQFIISGTSAPTTKSNLFAAENPNGVGNAGCIAPTGEFVFMIDPSGDESSRQYPCFEHPTLTDLLDAKQISWRYYAPSAGSIWTGPNAIQHICAPDATGTVCMGLDWANNVILHQTQVLTDIVNRQLPAVSWVIPNGQASDHPAANDGSGPSWVASIVNAIGSSPYWSNTAIFIAWDDWGGWYDHVAPKVINSYEYGFRVPLIVVSPFARPGYVSHVTHDFGSILKFIEKVYNLPSLGYADAPADDLSDCFDFSQTPLTFQTITAQFDANHFLNDKRSPGDPDDD
jgi:phospholipase C